MADETGWTLHYVGLAEVLMLLESAASYPQPGVEAALQRLYGDESLWPCPFCREHRPCSAVGRVGLHDRDVPEQLGDFAHSVKETSSVFNFLSDIMGTLLEKAVGKALGIGEDEFAVVYQCPEHHNFYIRFVLSGYANPVNVYIYRAHRSNADPFHVYVERNGRMELKLARHMACPGVLRDVDLSGRVRRIALCAQILEWWGELGAPGDGRGGYTCGVHGDQTASSHMGYLGPYVVASRVVQS
jgi:hypothetical protein